MIQKSKYQFIEKLRRFKSTDGALERSSLNAASLAYFRIFFGLMMLYSSLRFLAKGWVKELYVDTTFHFKYWGFEWVEPLGSIGTHALFITIAVAAFLVMVGWFYQIAIIAFFILFSYAELMDATNYLNHYYFISIMAFLLIWLPANAAYSIDNLKNQNPGKVVVPNWMLHVLKLQIALVYIFAGVAKINYDWLVEAEPLFHWLRSKYDFPLLGSLFQYKATAYFFSWSGCLYDLCIPFLLLYKGTRRMAFLAVVMFHVLTSLLFPIGVFPFVMIGSATLFFSSAWHQKVLNKLRLKAQDSQVLPQPFNSKLETQYSKLSFIKTILAIHFIIQLALPLRHLLYPSNLFWSEEGYRYSWRVMLTDKTGIAFFRVEDEKGKKTLVNLDDYLTERQQKYVATNPDFMVQMAHQIKADYEQKGYEMPKVFVESYLNLNAKGSAAFSNPNIDLASQNWGIAPKSWILPLKEINS